MCPERQIPLLPAEEYPGVVYVTRKRTAPHVSEMMETTVQALTRRRTRWVALALLCLLACLREATAAL
jgi:hypothetical protein